MHKMFEGLRGKMFEFAEFTAYFSTLFPTSPFFVSIQFSQLHVVLHFWKVNEDNVHWTPLYLLSCVPTNVEAAIVHMCII